MTVFCRYFVFFLLRSLSVELYLHLILIHSFTLTQPHHNPSTPILKVTLSIWENLWGVRQFIQSVDVLRIQLWSRFGDEREAREDSWCVCVCLLRCPFLKYIYSHKEKNVFRTRALHTRFECVSGVIVRKIRGFCRTPLPWTYNWNASLCAAEQISAVTFVT